jgi:nicotinate-nucleotide--dimethylbenzimidazole phosphoribosyltransferase
VSGEAEGSRGLDLVGIAREVRWPPVDPQDAAREALAAAGVGPGYGRLTELAVWWASVRNDPAALPPSRVAGLGLTTPLAQAARLPVRRVPFMPPDTVRAALAWGVAMGDALADEGTDLLLLAVNDTASRRVLAAELLGADAVDALGWPLPQDAARSPGLAGLIDDAQWMDDVSALRDGLRAVRGMRDDPAGLLDAIGSTVLAAATGLLLESAARRTPVLLDGPGAAAAGLLVRELAWEAPDWWQIVPAGPESLHERVLAMLRMTPLPGPVLAVEDGTAAVLAADLLAASAALLAAAADSTADAAAAGDKPRTPEPSE